MPKYCCDWYYRARGECARKGKRRRLGILTDIQRFRLLYKLLTVLKCSSLCALTIFSIRKCRQTSLSYKIFCTNGWILNRPRMLFCSQHIPPNWVEINPYENRGWRPMVEDISAPFFPFVTIGAQGSQEWLGYRWLPGLSRMESQYTSRLIFF